MAVTGSQHASSKQYQCPDQYVCVCNQPREKIDCSTEKKMDIKTILKQDRTLPYQRVDGGTALVVWPGMLFPEQW